MKWTTKLFDEKVALTPGYHYDGVTGGDKWRQKVKDYMIGCCPDIRMMLD